MLGSGVSGMVVNNYVLPPGFRQIPEYVNLTNEILKSAGDYASRTALVHDSVSISYGQMSQSVEKFSSALHEMGIGQGMPVLIRMQNCPDFAIAFLALCRIGAIPVLQNSLATAAEIKDVIDNSQAVAAIAAADLAEPLRAHVFDKGMIVAGDPTSNALTFESMLQDGRAVVPAARTRANDPAFFVYTSGTTGKPKGIVHAHRWIIALGDSNNLRIPPERDDVVLSTAEWSFIAGLGQNLLFPLRNGVRVATLSGRAVPENILGIVERFGVTLLYSVATIYRRILAIDEIEGRFNLSSLRGCNSTGEPLEKATCEEWKKRFGSDIWEHYGISEMQMVFGQGPLLPLRPGSVGPPLPGTIVAVLDDEYRPVPAGTVGNLLIEAKNPGFFLGYNRDPEMTAHVMRNGWYHTGDLASQDDDGYIWIAGRSDDCFKSRGIFISPVEIENVLREHPAVAEACVVPRPDPEIGNKIRAVIALKSSYKPNEILADEIKNSLTGRIARYKIPHIVEFSESLPKSAVGKVLRRVLRDAPSTTL